MAEVISNSHSHSGSVSEVLLLEFWVVLAAVVLAVEFVAVDGLVPKCREKRPGAWVCGGMEEAGRSCEERWQVDLSAR